MNVIDDAGAPVAGALVDVRMTRHEFGFGTAVDADLLVMTREQFERSLAAGHGSHVGNRDAQAAYVKDVLTLAFSHPARDGVVQWGFRAKRHWRPESALWQADWSLRPVGQVYRDLVLGGWGTRAAVKAGADGAAVVRGFRGSYTVTVTRGDETASVDLTLGDGGATVEVRL